METDRDINVAIDRWKQRGRCGRRGDRQASSEFGGGTGESETVWVERSRDRKKRDSMGRKIERQEGETVWVERSRDRKERDSMGREIERQEGGRQYG